jgi:enoyl-CoA hydratase
MPHCEKDELTPTLQGLLIDPSQARRGLFDSRQPVGFVDLGACPRQWRLEVLPPFPLIGFGDSVHPMAPLLDAVIEPPISVAAIIRQVNRAPHAAAVTVQLLRSLHGVSCELALPLESIGYGLLQAGAEHRAWLDSRLPAQPAPIGRLVVERRDTALYLTLDRPAARNAIDRLLRDELFEAFTLAALDSDIDAIKLRAVGASFSVGGDLDEFGSTRDPVAAHWIRSRTSPAWALGTRAEILEVHVQGACIGAGLELAAFAARLTATSDAWFQLPELSMGLIPGAGGCVSVPRRIGRQRAALMILSGRRINSATARRWGLIDAIEERPKV